MYRLLRRMTGALRFLFPVTGGLACWVAAGASFGGAFTTIIPFMVNAVNVLAFALASVVGASMFTAGASSSRFSPGRATRALHRRQLGCRRRIPGGGSCEQFGALGEDASRDAPQREAFTSVVDGSPTWHEPRGARAWPGAEPPPPSSARSAAVTNPSRRWTTTSRSLWRLLPPKRKRVDAHRDARRAAGGALVSVGTVAA